MKIAHIDTERSWRGGQQQVHFLLDGLKKLGHENFGIVRRGSPLASKLKEESYSLLEISPWSEWDVWSAKKMRDYFKLMKVDVVHAHTSHAVSLAALATIKTKIPLVVTRRVDFHLARNPFSKLKYSAAKKVIAISKKVQEILIKCGIPVEKIALVPSGIKLERYRRVEALNRESWGFSPQAIVVGQVAALAPHKDQATFIKALHKLRNESPEIVGVLVGEGNLKPKLERLVHSLNMEKKVLFLGFREDPLKCIKTFDLFCLSSSEEGLGTSVLDAMALQVPVIATRTGGIPEMIQDGETGFLAPPKNPDELAGVILKAVQSRDKFKKITLNALAKAQEFDVNRTVVGTEAIYREVLRN